VGVRLDIEVLARREELEALRGPWSELWERCPGATVFQRPEWLLPWCRELGAGDLFTIACRAEGRLVGLAPLAILRRGGERVVASLGVGLSDYNDVLAEPGLERPVAAAVLAYLGERADAWDVLDFEQLRPASPVLAAEAPWGWSDEIAHQDACPAVAIPEGGAWDAALPPDLRVRLRKARRMLARVGEASVELADSARVDEVLDALFETHRARWSSRGAIGVLDESVRPFHRAVTRGMLARGALRLFALRLGPRIIAVLYGFAERGALACYLTGFDPAFARYSPGVQLLAGAIEHAARQGARTIDFLRGREAYKYEWGAVDRSTYRRTLRPARARLAVGAGAPEEPAEKDASAAVLAAVLAGELSPEVGLTRLLSEADDVDAVARAIAAVVDAAAPGEERARLDELRSRFHERREACAGVLELLRAHREAGLGGAGASAPARCARLFDELVGRSEEASVAAYSLGDPALLERATREVVELFDRWGLLAPDRAVLQIGCGIGRFEAALAGRVREAWGLDVAPRMIEAARRRCAGLSNVRLEVCSGVDLGGVPSGCFELVYAVDTFPYVVDAGAAAVEGYFQEGYRALRPGGELVILSYSYRGDERRDRADVARLAARCGFEILVNGGRLLSLWDGRAYRLRKPEG
jgi:CelD/BcsL family acetyltransferase involved in cellulose biosynthesis/ubiquinone/menaquinone biosynthesis C-methylase UbiE